MRKTFLRVLVLVVVTFKSHLCFAVVTKEQLIIAAKANESQVKDYMAKMTFDCHAFFENIDDNGNWVNFLGNRQHTYFISHSILADPIQNRYRVTSEHVWGEGQNKNKLMEQLGSNEVQILTFTSEGAPEEGVIDNIANTRYFQFSADPFILRSYIHVSSSKDPIGFVKIPLSVALEQAEHFAVLGTTTIEGEDCLQISALTPDPHGEDSILFWVSLARNRGLIILAQQLQFLPPLNSGDFADLFAVYDNNFTQLATGVKSRIPPHLRSGKVSF